MNGGKLSGALSLKERFARIPQTADRRRQRRHYNDRVLLNSADNCLLESSIKKFDERLGMNAVP